MRPTSFWRRQRPARDGPSALGERIKEAPTAGAALLALLGATITSASGTADGTLTLEWSDKRRLTIFDSWRQYESYTITSGDRLIVV